KKLLDALVNPEDTMNFSSFKEGAAKDKGIIDLAETMPFFAKPAGPDGNGYRVILIENSGFGGVSASKAKDDSGKNPDDLILDYLSNIPETTIFIFVEEEKISDEKISGKVDKRYRLFKAADKQGRAIEMNMPGNEEVLKRWIFSKLKAEDKRMKADAWERFLTMTGSNMNNMDMELKKLISYVGARADIQLEDVNAVCIETTDIKIFELTNALSDRDSRKAFDIYNSLIVAKEEPRSILSQMINLYRKLLVIKEMSSIGRSDDEIAKVIGNKSFDVKMNRPRAKRFSTDELQHFLEEAGDYLFKINTGQLNETMAVELLLMKYS
ncbi:MAG: DNA polymerase III subunit delta, partial [Pseudobutyrivibrio sp.]|nr:DNA polymerase III subunit delta [Pseudobutyrivibrio sp.]